MREIRLVRGVEKEVLKEIEIPKGKLTRAEPQAEKLDARMAKVEKRTDFLIQKAKRKKVESPQVKTHREHFGRTAKTPSLLEFYCLKGLPKIILRHIQEKVVFDENLQKWISIIDTEDLKSLSGKTASHLSVQILRLEKQGWFELLMSNNAGVRVIQINPETFPVKQ